MPPTFREFLQQESAPMTDAGQPIVQEVTPPGMEAWVKDNKAKFIKQYGPDRGLSVLYSTAWDLHHKQQAEAGSSMDVKSCS